MCHIQYVALLTGSGSNPGAILLLFYGFSSSFVWESRATAQSKMASLLRENSSGINNAAFMNYVDISLPSFFPGFEAQSCRGLLSAGRLSS